LENLAEALQSISVSELKSQVNFEGRLNPSNMSYLEAAENGLSPWNFSAGKRVFDAATATAALTVTLPLMATIAVAIKLCTPGPALFRQQRVGRGGRLFEILKFRTMVHRSAANMGTSITRKGDARVTRLGRWLRRSKLDELPQLFNVLRGDMSLVGPRPDLPEFYDSLPPEQRLILALQPGITGWATLQFHDEEGHLTSVPECELSSYYINVLFPEKVRLALDYARRATFLSDLGIIFRTIIAA
jgi:lipopolysaccharide/colanic/teichoic acid biosynthesis glycosyltransferase